MKYPKKILKKRVDTWLFIVNSTAGQGKTGKKINTLVNTLNRHKFDFEIELTKAPKHATEIARNYIKKGFRKIVAVGGDGTINEIITGIMLSGKAEDVIFGIVPKGGGNDFARNLHFPHKIDKSIKILEKKYVLPVDVGKIEDQYFINAFGIGFDAKVAANACKLRLLNGLPRYLVALMMALINLKSYNFKLIIDGVLIDKPVLLVSFGNGFSTGGGFLLTPDAKVNDGIFDICIIDKVKLFRLLKLLPTVLTGKHINYPEVEIKQAKIIEIKTEKKLPIYYDGELPRLKDPYNFKIELIPQKINLICKEFIEY